MLKRSLLALALVSCGVSAATVTVNGVGCGNFKGAQIDASGNVAMATDGTCGAVAPPPEPEPPAPDPFKCPPGVTCSDRPFPVIPQELVSIKGKQILSFKVKAPEAGSGAISTMNYSGASATLRMTLSTLPGEMAGTQFCTYSGFEVTTVKWTTATGTRLCKVPSNAALYINVQATNCADGATCKFYLKAN